MEALEYTKVGPEYGRLYERILNCQKNSIWICDSLDHNEDIGCSNPDCFKYNGKKQCKPNEE